MLATGTSHTAEATSFRLTRFDDRVRVHSFRRTSSRRSSRPPVSWVAVAHPLLKSHRPAHGRPAPRTSSVRFHSLCSGCASYLTPLPPRPHPHSICVMVLFNVNFPRVAKKCMSLVASRFFIAIVVVAIALRVYNVEKFGDALSPSTRSTSMQPCRSLRAGINGTVTYTNGNNPDSIATFQCRRGFVLVGSAVLVCTQHGFRLHYSWWDNPLGTKESEPRCVERVRPAEHRVFEESHDNGVDGALLDDGRHRAPCVPCDLRRRLLDIDHPESSCCTLGIGAPPPPTTPLTANAQCNDFCAEHLGATWWSTLPTIAHNCCPPLLDAKDSTRICTFVCASHSSSSPYTFNPVGKQQLSELPCITLAPSVVAALRDLTVGVEKNITQTCALRINTDRNLCPRNLHFIRLNFDSCYNWDVVALAHYSNNQDGDCPVSPSHRLSSGDNCYVNTAGVPSQQFTMRMRDESNIASQLAILLSHVDLRGQHAAEWVRKRLFHAPLIDLFAPITPTTFPMLRPLHDAIEAASIKHVADVIKVLRRAGYAKALITYGRPARLALSSILNANMYTHASHPLIDAIKKDTPLLQSYFSQRLLTLMVLSSPSTPVALRHVVLSIAHPSYVVRPHSEGAALMIDVGHSITALLVHSKFS